MFQKRAAKTPQYVEMAIIADQSVFDLYKEKFGTSKKDTEKQLKHLLTGVVLAVDEVWAARSTPIRLHPSK